MLIFQGSTPSELVDMQYLDYFRWYPGMFANCGTDPAKISTVVNNSLYGNVKINNITAAEVRTNDSTNGLDIRYGVTPQTDVDLRYPNPVLANLAMLRFGPIPKPTAITVDLKAIFGVQQRECFMVLAICGSAIYSLFNLYQGVVDGNYGYVPNGNGIWCNNGTTKLKSLTSTTTYTGTRLISAMPKCFTLGETFCDIAIVRLRQMYWPETGSGMKNASTLYLKNLEITTK